MLKLHSIIYYILLYLGIFEGICTALATKYVLTCSNPLEKNQVEPWRGVAGWYSGHCSFLQN
jgi:hypothetical protein